MEVPQEVKHGITICPAVPLLGVHPNELKARTQTDTCTSIFIAALFTIAKKWKQPKCPSTDEEIKWGPYIQWNIIQGLKRKEILTRATTWLNLKDIMLSPTSHT